MNKHIKQLVKEYTDYNQFIGGDIITDDNINSNEDVIRDFIKHHPKTKEQLRALIEQYLAEGKTNFNDIDVSAIKDFSLLFYNLPKELSPDLSLSPIGDIEISEWDVSNGENFKGMFNECYNLNADFSKWNVSNGKYFQHMFMNCHSLKCDFSKWQVKPEEVNAWGDMNINFMFTYCPRENIIIPDTLKNYARDLFRS